MAFLEKCRVIDHIILQMCLMKSIKDGYRWGVFTPEQDPPDYFYNDLIYSAALSTTIRSSRFASTHAVWNISFVRVSNKS